MTRTCERAIAIGLPALVFTEHLDFGSWRVGRGDFDGDGRGLVDRIDDHGLFSPPPLDVTGYLAAIDRCRHRFPGLRILAGVEYGQPHLFDAEAARLVDLTALDRVNGSLHTLGDGDVRAEPLELFRSWEPGRVIREYLAEIPRMLAGSDSFQTVTHLDYALRSWPVETAGPFDPRRFEEEFRGALRSIAASDRALEMNTSRLWSWLPEWWADEGGRAVSFGSDAHTPDVLGRHLPEAAAMLEHHGFRPGRRPEEFWTRGVAI